MFFLSPMFDVIIILQIIEKEEEKRRIEHDTNLFKSFCRNNMNQY